MTGTPGPDDDTAAQIDRLRFAASVLILSAWSAQDAASWMEILHLVHSRHPDCDSISLHGEPLEICVWKQRQLIHFIVPNDPLAMQIAASYDLVDDPSPSLGPEGHYRSTAEITEAFESACAAMRRSSPG